MSTASFIAQIVLWCLVISIAYAQRARNSELTREITSLKNRLHKVESPEHWLYMLEQYKGKPLDSRATAVEPSETV